MTRSALSATASRPAREPWRSARRGSPSITPWRKGTMSPRRIGILRRVVLVDTGEEVLELINPTLLETSGEQVGAEGCLSVPGKYGLVKRPMVAKVRAQDRNGNWYEAEGEELIARCFCHELDHLDGIVYTEVMERFLTDEELAGDED